MCVDEATDSQNCGGCGLACDQCTNGRCIRVLASGQSRPNALAVTSSEVVWAIDGVDTADGKSQGTAILKVPIGGGVPETLAQSDTEIWSLAIDSGYVYWAKSNTALSMSGAIMKTPMTGGATTTLAAASWPNNVAVSGDVVYWTDQRGIMSVPTSGGSPVVFAPGNLGPLALAAGRAYWFDSGNQNWAFRTRGLAPGANEVTLATWSLNQLSSPNSGVSGAVLKLAASTTDLYWTDDGGGGWLMKVPLCGGRPTLISADFDDVAVAVDADSVYWMNMSYRQTTQPISHCNDGGAISCQIVKAPLAGGSPITLAPVAGDVYFLVVDDTSVYFTDALGGTVVKVTPK